MIYKFSVHRNGSEAGPAYLTRHLPDLTAWRDYYIETVEPLSDSEVHALRSALCDHLTEWAEFEVPLRVDAVSVAYARGIVDNESDSIVALCEVLGISARAAKVATTYRSASPELSAIIASEAFNGNIEELHTSEPKFDTLMPVASYEPAERFDVRNASSEELEALGRANGRSLEPAKMRRIAEIAQELELEFVTDAMLEALDARWSDHCAHTTWKSLGNLLGRMVASSKATKNPNVVSMFHDNAGIWSFYDGYGIAIKAETHNGPSAVSAYFGQLTKVGGVLRDILGTGKGADPIGVFEYTATGLPDSPSPVPGRPAPKKIAHETIRAIKEYGNTFGVPMMWSHMTFHPDYRAKPFALGGSIGLIPLQYAERGRPMAGDHVVLIGGLTGSDGIHGASASSAGANMDTTSVQIGSPLEEIKFREAIIELRDRDCIRAITDLGAAGLNSAVGEMGEDVGVWMNTALVPLKTGGLPMWRILLSESQERMALAIAPELLDLSKEILDRHEVRNTVIGRFTGSGRYCVVHDEDLDEKKVVALDVAHLPEAREVGFDLPYSAIDYFPEPKVVRPPKPLAASSVAWPEISEDDLVGIARSIVADVEVQDQSYAASQYDSSVGGRSYYGPDYGTQIAVPTSYYASRPVYGHPGAIVFNTSFNPWLFEAQPQLAARQHFLSLLCGQVLAGVQMLDICLCDNFYTPHLEPDAEGWLVAMVEEVATLAERFRTPFISGKDSSAGSAMTDEGVISVPPAVFLSALGKVPDASGLRPENWSGSGNLLVRVGLETPSPAGTAAARVLDLKADSVDEVDVEAASQFLAALAKLDRSRVPSGRLLGPGGTLGAVLLGAMGSGLAVELDRTAEDLSTLLQEHRIGALIEVPENEFESLPQDLAPVRIGRIAGGSASVRFGEMELLASSVTQAWQSSYAEALR